MTNRVNVDQLLADLHTAAINAGFTVETYGEIAKYPLYGCIRESDGSSDSPKRIYISTGIHGDEPAPPLALLELLQSDTLPRRHDYYICPCMNPSGLAAGTRENSSGIDLNRDYRDFSSKEIQAHRDWLKSRITSLDLALHLHEDWETKGFYLYELNLHGHSSRAVEILAVTQTVLPIESASRIDGHRARAGLIRPSAIPDIPEGLPEAIYFQQHFGLLSYTLETPSSLKLESRVRGMRAAALAAII